ncbi:MAG: hypothetical protein MJ066_03185 [Clostridia bacterium]|nr:hypothetical protein [Clostridia bacterium]
MKKTKLLVCNIIIAVICAFVLFMYYSQPFFAVKVGFSLNGDMLEDVMGSSGSEGSSFGGDLDFNSILGEDGLEFKIKVGIDSKALFKALTLDKDGVKKFVEDEIIGPNIEGIIEAASEVLTTVVTNVVKEAAKQAIKDELKAVSVDDNISNAVDNIIDAFNDENATPDSFAKTITDQIDILAATGNYEIPEMSAEDKAELEKSIKDMLDELQLVDKDGKIADPVAAISALLSGAMGEDDIKGGINDVVGGDKQSSTGGLSVTNFAKETEDKTNTALVDMLKENLADLIKIDDSTANILMIAFKALAGFLIFLMFTWAIVFILSLAKLGAKNPGVKVWLPVVFGGGFIGGILHIAQMVLKILMKKGTIPFLNELPVGLSIEITTSMFYACWGACAFIILCWFVGYARTRRRLRKELKYGEDSSSKKGGEKSNDFDDEDNEPSSRAKKTVTKTTTKTVTKRAK